MSLEFNLSFAGVSFVSDSGKIVRLSPEKDDGICSETNPIRQQQPLPDLIDELNRLIPSKYLQDFGITYPYPGRNLASIAYLTQLGPQPGPDVRIGDWYYPNTACRWGVFRGLATSQQMKVMQIQSAASGPQPFVMQANPISPDNTQNNIDNYTVEDQLYMLPPRPLAELGGQFDGLFLITLVDERYYWQYSPVSLRVNQNTTWGDLIAQLAEVLDVTIDYSPIQSVYMQPEVDSQFWCNMESAAVLLDAIAYNIGRTVVRVSAGEYYLMTAVESGQLVTDNRGVAERVIRTAGGDIFNSGTQLLPSGDLQASKNFVIPSSVTVSFPKYVVGDDPVPHFLNSRTRNQRPSAWFEQSYGDTYDIEIPVGDAGEELSNLVGIAPYSYSIHSTAKALLETESTGTPINALQLLALARQLANDFYNDQTVQALDEVYPGTFTWEPEGIHDIIWTFSSRSRQVTTRVMKTEWNETIPSRQHATPPPESSQDNPITYPQTNTPRGVGGLSVALNVRDTFSGSISNGTPTTILSNTMLSGAMQAIVTNVAYLPTQNRWRGQIDNEVILFEGTSGGIQNSSIDYRVDVVYRGIDGTKQVQHDNSTQIKQLLPDVNYGTNYLRFDKGQFIYPAEWTSGGIQGAVVVPQIQSVYAFDGVSLVQTQSQDPNNSTEIVSGGTLINGRTMYSGQVFTYDSTKTDPWVPQEYVWIDERNQSVVTSGVFYDGQFQNYSASGPVAPIYSINAALGTSSETSGSPTSLCCTPGVPTYVNGWLTTIPCSPCFTTPVDYFTALNAVQGCFGFNFVSTPGTNVANWQPICNNGSTPPPPPPECSTLSTSGTSPYTGNSSLSTGNQFSIGTDATPIPPGDGQLINIPNPGPGTNNLINLPTCTGLKYYISDQPGIFFFTEHENPCITDVEAVISYPPPNSNTLVNFNTINPGTGGSIAAPINFRDSCTITWLASGNPLCNTIDVTANWNGLKVYGTSHQGGNVDECLPAEFQGFSNILLFDPCDFYLQQGGASSSEQCPPLLPFTVKTNGLTDVILLSYLGTDCTPHTAIFTIRDGLIIKVEQH